MKKGLILLLFLANMACLLLIFFSGEVDSVANIIFLVIISVIISILIYFIPTIVAIRREHLQKTAIILINIFLGWSFIGWVVALVWACMNPNTSNGTYQPIEETSIDSRLKNLEELKNNGIITETEYEKKRQDILSDL